MGRKKNLPLLEKVEITDIASEGNALARVENLVVFVPMLVPGDVVDIRVVRKKKNYAEGRVEHFHKYSDLRISPECRHFGTCGGCRWQHLPYKLQLAYKERQVLDNLERIGKIKIQRINSILGSEEIYRYRNKLEFSFSNRRWLSTEEIAGGRTISPEGALGFHVPGLFDKVIDISECHLQPSPSDEIRNSIRDYALQRGLEYFDLREQKGFLRNIIVRNNLAGEVMLIVVFGRDEREEITGMLDMISEKFSAVTSLFFVINSKRNDSVADLEPVLYKGNPYLVEKIGELVFRIGPKSFSQTNTRQAEVLYNVALRFAGLTGREIVYDLYTGTGTIANLAARHSMKVIGLEYISEAVDDAILNSRLNGIENAFFHSGEIKDLLTADFFASNGVPDVIITDPPRAGMHEDVSRAILQAAPERIVYISCNPATQARDIAILSEKYNAAETQPVDMFPHTHHVENVVLLVRRDEANNT